MMRHWGKGGAVFRGAMLLGSLLWGASSVWAKQASEGIWGDTLSSEAMRLEGLLSAELPSLSRQAMPERALPAGQWSVVWLDAMSGLQVVPVQGKGLSGLRAQRIHGETKVQALIEVPLRKASDKGWILYNDTMARRAFVIGGAARAMSLRLQVPRARVPDQLWSRENQRLWKAAKRREASPLRSGVLDEHTEELFQAATALRSGFPKARALTDAWLAYALSEAQLRNRPRTLPGWERSAAKIQGKGLVAWGHEDPRFSDTQYYLVQGPQTLWIEAEGPGALQLQARALVQDSPMSTGELRTLKVSQGNAVYGEWELSQKVARLACSVEAPESRCPVSVGTKGFLGQALRPRLAVRKSELRFQLDVGPGGYLIAARNEGLRPRLGADPLREQAQSACARARGAMVAPKAPIAQVMRVLMPGCELPGAFSKDLFSAGLLGVCREQTQRSVCSLALQRMAQDGRFSNDAYVAMAKEVCAVLGTQDSSQELRGRLALDLGARGAIEVARSCVEQGPRPGASLAWAGALSGVDSGWGQGFLEECYRRVNDSPVALPGKERETLIEQWKTRSRWNKIESSASEASLGAWLVGEPQSMDEASGGWMPSKSWHELEANQALRVLVPASSDGQESLGRVDLAWCADAKSSVQVRLDGAPAQVEPSATGSSWLLAPGEHQIEVQAPQGCRVAGTIARSETQHSLLKVRMAPLLDAGQPSVFTLSESGARLPLGVQLRRTLQSEAKGPVNLWLRDDLGSKIPLTLFPSHLQPDSALGLHGAGSVSAPISLAVKLPEKAQRVWFEGDAAALEGWMVAMYERQSEAPWVEPTTQKESVFKVGEGHSDPEVARAQRLVSDGRWVPLRQILQGWAQRIAALTLDGRLESDSDKKSAQLEILDAYQSYLASGAGRFVREEQSSGPAVTAMPFLGDKAPLSPNEAIHRFDEAAAALEAGKEGALSRAIWAAYRLSAAYGDREEPQPRWPLAYGLMHQAGYALNNPRLNLLRAKSARPTYWTGMTYASQSSGFEHTQRSGSVYDALQDPLGAPFESEPGVDYLSRAQRRGVPVTMATDGQIRLSVFCRPLPFGERQGTLAWAVDDEAARPLAFEAGREAQRLWDLPAGGHQVTIVESSSSPQRCAVRLQVREQRPQAGEGQAQWRSVSIPQQRRWFVAGAKRPLAFHVQGPGVLRVQARAIAPSQVQASPLTVSINEREDQPGTKLSLPVAVDPEIQLTRTPSTAIGERSQTLVPLPSNRLYLVKVGRDTGEALVRVSTRELSDAANTVTVDPEWMNTLEMGLRGTPEPILAKVSLPEPATPVTLRRIAIPDPSASWSLRLRTGLDQETEYEALRSRFSTGFSGAWSKELKPQTLWLGAQVGAQSQSWNTPMLYAQVQADAQLKRAPLRFRLGVHAGVQPMKGKLPNSVSPWFEVQGSLRNGFRRYTAWDLRPSLRIDGRSIQESAWELANQGMSEKLHSRIYRAYTMDHPWAVKPRLLWTWREFRNARFDVGVDTWLNSDFASLDRFRAWGSAVGLYRFNARQPSWLVYELGYRWTRAFADEHRDQAFSRHRLAARLRWQWQWSTQRRLALGLANHVIFTGNGFAGNEIRLIVGMDFDPLQAFRHRPPRSRRFLGEFARQDWETGVLQ